ncbi:MAG: matrixin family metalloprotease [ANME-2 cluster archaeon]|nr:matrixin family metalloprotease [ANME-2 cluster archaeon]
MNNIGVKMAESVLKTVVIYTFVLVTALAIATAFIFIPAYVHHVESHVPGGFDSLYLSKYSPYSTIVVEVDYQPGMEPDPKAMAALQEKLELYSQKQVVIYLNQEIGYDEVPILISGNDLFDLTNNLKQAHRDYRTGWLGGNITLYIMYLDTVWQPDNSEYSSNMPAYQYMTNTRVYSAGVTYAADSMIIFRDALTQEDTETTILLHELGHIWGLDHSNVSGDVMNSEFNVYNSVPLNHESGINQFPTNYSSGDTLRLTRLHESLHILPFF